MAKNVSTKFGDRRLVHLPPVNMTGARTAHVDTIAPPSDAAEYKQRVFEARAQYQIQKQYAYRSSGARRDTRHAWMTPSRSQLPDGNLVTDAPPPRIGDQIFQQLYQEASASTMANYDKGQYPVIPPVSGQPNFMQYTNQGLSTMPQQQQPQQLAASYPQPAPAPPTNFQPQVPPPVPQQTNHNACQSCTNNNNNPNEKHIYYGPNGEVLPGPPSGFNTQSPVNFNQFPEDFAIEGVLQYGRLAQMSLIEARRGFPKIPDFLIRDLLEKYGHYERTIVRVVMRGGQAYVHATPDLPFAENPGYQTEYVPVVLDDDEEFDYDKFYNSYQNQRYRTRRYENQIPPRRYRSPPAIPRSFPLYERHYDRRRSPDIRPDSTDPAAHLRWKKNDDRRNIVTAPVFPPPSRDSNLGF